MISLRQYLNMSTARNLYVITTALGVIVFLVYCLRINFFPTGMSLSDVIFFLLVILSFLLLAGITFCGWYSTGCIIVWLFLKLSLLICRKMNKTHGKSYRNLKGTYRAARKLHLFKPMFALISVSLIIGIVILKFIFDGKLQWPFVILSIFMVSLSILIIASVNYGKQLTREKKRHTTIGIFLFMVLPFLFYSGMGAIISDRSMTLIGVKKDDATFFLKDNDLEMARHLTGNNGQSFFYGDVLFTGVGDTSLLVINHKRLIVKNANLTISF